MVSSLVNTHLLLLLQPAMSPCMMGKPERWLQRKQTSCEFSVCCVTIYGKCVSSSQFTHFLSITFVKNHLESAWKCFCSIIIRKSDHFLCLFSDAMLWNVHRNREMDTQPETMFLSSSLKELWDATLRCWDFAKSELAHSGGAAAPCREEDEVRESFFLGGGFQTSEHN